MTAAQPSPESTGQLIKRLLQTGGVVVIVGGRPSNFNQEIWSHPRYVFLDADKQVGTLPTNTRYVVMLRFVSHAISSSVMSQAKNRRIPLAWLQTGEAKAALAEAMAVPETTVTGRFRQPPVLQRVPIEPAPVVPETFPKLERPISKGDMTAFVRAHVNPEATSKLQEAERIFRLAAEQGLHFNSVESIRQAIHKNAPKSVKSTDPSASTPQPMSTPPPSASSSLADDFTEAERLANDAIAAIELLAGFLKKMRAEVNRARKQTERMKQILSEDN